jgi:LCP family protein required for cell wall assembly
MSDPRPRAPITPLARHGRLSKSGAAATLFRVLGIAVAVLVVSGVSIGAVALHNFDSNIKVVHLVGEKTDGPPPALGSYEGGFNILIAGSDTREGQGGVGGSTKDDGSVLNDVTMLVHVSQDQTNAVAVSIPRDMVVPIPACPREDGKGNYSSMSAMPINNTLAYGGLPCTVLTVEALTGLKIPFAALITFQGVIQMSDAVGGVPVCVNGPLKDRYTGIDLPAAGNYTLSGGTALAFLRSRHGVGDGSDLGRISSQQVYLSSLVRTVKSNDTLTNPVKLYSIAEAATANMTLSSSLKNLTTMASMAIVLKGIPLDHITFVQYPGTTGVGGVYSGKVAPLVGPASALFAKIKADQPFTLDSGTGRGSVTDPSAPAATPAPSATGTANAAAPIAGVLGQTAADYTCSKVNN